MSWSGRVVERMRPLVVEAYGSTCWLCGAPIDLSLDRRHPWSLSIDHVLPVAYGGSDDLANLRPSHRRCNLRRGARPTGPTRRAESGFSPGPGPEGPALPNPPKTPEKNAD